MLLIVPISEKLSWKNPPVITIVLILINCLVYFAFQLNENEKLYNAGKFYMESGLAEIEVPLYLKHLEEKGDDEDEFSDYDYIFLFQELFSLWIQINHF